MSTAVSPTTRPQRSGHWGQPVPGDRHSPHAGGLGLRRASPAMSAALGEQVNLAIGQTVAMVGEPLRITFVEVAGDSRCPRGATCVWQGEAICRLKMNLHGSETTVIVKEPGLTEAPGVADFNNYDNPVPTSPVSGSGQGDEARGLPAGTDGPPGPVERIKDE